MNLNIARLRALGDSTRFRLARVLVHAEGELCICELVDILRRPQYAVSRAAAGLRAAAVVEERREGRLVYYRLSADPFVRGLASVLRAAQSDDAEFRHDLDRLRWRIEIRSQGKCVVTYRDAAEPARTRQRVLFLCVHNTARSQIAAAYLKRLAADRFEVESAGLEPGRLNPYAVAALAEEGIDISTNRPKAVIDLYRRGLTFDYVITLCSLEAERGCPPFPGPVVRLSWPFPDPGTFDGSSAEIAAQVAGLRDRIRQRVAAFVEDHGSPEGTRARSRAVQQEGEW